MSVPEPSPVKRVLLPVHQVSAGLSSDDLDAVSLRVGVGSEFDHECKEEANYLAMFARRESREDTSFPQAPTIRTELRVLHDHIARRTPLR